MAGIENFAAMLNNMSGDGAGRMGELFNHLSPAGSTAYAQFCNQATPEQSKALAAWFSMATTEQVKQAASRLNSGKAGTPAAFLSWLDALRNGQQLDEPSQAPTEERLRTFWQKLIGLFKEDPSIRIARLKDEYLEAVDQRRGSEAILKAAQQVRDAIESHAGMTHPDYGAWTQVIGTWHYISGRYSEALILYEEALKTFEAHPGQESAAGFVHFDIGGVERELKNPRSAEQHYIRAIELTGAARPVLLQTGEFFFQQGDYGRAIKFMEQGFASEKSGLTPKDHVMIGGQGRLADLAVAYYRNGDETKAESILRQGLADIQAGKRLPDGEIDRAAVLTNLLALYWRNQQRDEALAVFR